MWWILHSRYGGNRTRAGTSPQSHTVYDLNHSANRVYTIGTGCSHHMWWEHSVPIVYTRLVEWLRSRTVWDGGLLRVGSIPSVSQMQKSSQFLVPGGEFAWEHLPVHVVQASLNLSWRTLRDMIFGGTVSHMTCNFKSNPLCTTRGPRFTGRWQATWPFRRLLEKRGVTSDCQRDATCYTLTSLVNAKKLTCTLWHRVINHHHAWATTRALDHIANKQRNWGARTPRQLARTMYTTLQKRFVNGWVYISMHLVKCRHSVLFGDLLNVPCPASCLCINQGLLVREILSNDPRNDLMCPLCTHDPYLFQSINIGICRHSVALYVSHWMCAPLPQVCLCIDDGLLTYLWYTEAWPER